MRIFPHILKRGAQKKIVLKIAAAVFLVTVVHLLELYSLTLCTKKPKNNANHFNYDSSPAIAFFSLIKFLVKWFIRPYILVCNLFFLTFGVLSFQLKSLRFWLRRFRPPSTNWTERNGTILIAFFMNFPSHTENNTMTLIKGDEMKKTTMTKKTQTNRNFCNLSMEIEMLSDWVSAFHTKIEEKKKFGSFIFTSACKYRTYRHRFCMPSINGNIWCRSAEGESIV